MTKFKIIALALAVAILCSACSLVTVNEEKDRAQVVATINGAKILKGELLDLYNNSVAEYDYMMQQYGLGGVDASMLAMIYESTWDLLIESTLQKQKIAELGIVLTPEDETAALEELNVQIEDFRSYIKSTVSDETGGTIDEAELVRLTEERMKQELESQGVDLEELRAQALETALSDKLKAELTKDIAATEDEIKKWYDDRLEEDKTTAADSPTMFEYATPEEPMLFVPEGYVYVKQVFLKPTGDDVSTQLSELKTKQDEWAAEMTELIVEDKTANAVKIDELEKQINDSKAESAKIKQDWYDTVRSKATTVYNQATAGNDFDALITQYNDDPGMKSEPTMSEGYLVGPKTTSYMQPFTDAAMALKNVGDVSPVTETDSGLHVLKLVKKVTPGAVPYEQVKEIARASVIAEKATAAMDEIMQQWKDAAKITKYENRVKDIAPPPAESTPEPTPVG